MKTKLLGLVLLGAVSVGMSGCVLNVGDGESEWSSYDSWQHKQQQNRTNLTRLTLGMSKQEVLSLMGDADFNEAYLDKDKEVHVLFYRTQRTNGDGKTTKDECTPIVISENGVVGWGDRAYASI